MNKGTGLTHPLESKSKMTAVEGWLPLNGFSQL